VNLNFLKSAFDRIGSQSKQLEQIAAASETTAAAVTAGGVLYTKVDEMVVLLRQIAENGMASSKEALKDAKVLGLVGKAMEPLGKGFQLVVAALNELPNADEATRKMDALVGGLVKLGDVGKSILQFAGYMILAAPLLMVAAIASPLLLISLFFITKGIEMVNNRVDLEGIEKFKALGDVGKSILLLGGSLALFGLIGPLAIMGAFFASGSILIIGGTFMLLEKMKILDKIEDGARALSFAALSILAIGVSLAMFELIAPAPQKMLEISAVIAGTALVFGIAGIFGDTILKGAKAMGFAALAILGLGLSLYFFDQLVPGDVINMETFKAFVVVGAITLGFLLAGKAATTIALGAVAMIIAGVAIIAIAFGISILEDALPEKNAWERIGQYGAIIGGLGAAMALAGAAAPFIIAGAAAMLVAGVSLIAIAGGISVLSSLKTEKLFGGNGLFADSGQKTKGFLGIGGGRPKTNLEVMIDSITDSFAINPLKSVAIAAGAATLLLAGAALLTLGSGISKFQKISDKADLPTLETNINEIVNSLAGTFGAIGNDPKLGKGGKKSLFASVFGGGSSSPVADGISAVMGMGEALTNIALGVQAMADLKFPTAYDKNGKPIAFESVNISEKIKQVAKNVNLILLGEDGASGLVGTFSNVGKANGPDKGIFTSTDYEKGVEMIQNVGNPLLSLAKAVQMMAEFKFPTGFDKDGNPTGFVKADGIEAKLEQVEGNIKLILLGKDGSGGLVGIFKKLGGEDDSGWFSASTIEKGAEIASMIADPIESIASAATKLMEGNLDATGAAEKIKVLIGALTSGNDADPSVISAKGQLWTMAGASYEKIGLAMPSISKGFKVSAKAINSMDLEKLTEARTMFEALATLTHGGDANNILSKMGDSLETALQNLAEMLNNFRDTVEEGNAGQQGALETVSSAVSSLKQSVAPAAATNTTAAQTTAAPQNNIDMSSVVRAIEDLENVLVQQGVRVRTI
jgi:hypothetical protein